VDESGKGDYFGGIAIAGVVVKGKELDGLGVKDSKKIEDKKVEKISQEIQKRVPCEVVYIGPSKYNLLYSKLGNVNKILAWGVGRVVENLLIRKEKGVVIVDKFGDERYVKEALMEKGKKVPLVQVEKGERNISVAGASVVAREKFLVELHKLSNTIGVRLPKGASEKVVEIGKELVKRYGEEILEKVAKLHFKTTEKIIKKGGNVVERLWAPWRINYIYGKKERGCIFCNAYQKKEEEGYVLYRDNLCVVMLNIYPYNNGHIMVAPKRHIPNIEDLTSEEWNSIFSLLKCGVKVLKEKMSPAGFNIGMNIGKLAGAGVEGHIHIHIVPRWMGDTNFMPVISDTKVMAQSLEESYKLLKEGFRNEGKCFTGNRC